MPTLTISIDFLVLLEKFSKLIRMSLFPLGITLGHLHSLHSCLGTCYYLLANALGSPAKVSNFYVYRPPTRISRICSQRITRYGIAPFFNSICKSDAGGLATPLVTEIEGRPFLFTNDMDIDEHEDSICEEEVGSPIIYHDRRLTRSNSPSIMPHRRTTELPIDQTRVNNTEGNHDEASRAVNPSPSPILP
ncbi:hypothetical protein LguiB_004202 [Lonicera macranthoides]